MLNMLRKGFQPGCGSPGSSFGRQHLPGAATSRSPRCTSNRRRSAAVLQTGAADPVARSAAARAELQAHRFADEARLAVLLLAAARVAAGHPATALAVAERRAALHAACHSTSRRSACGRRGRCRPARTAARNRTLDLTRRRLSGRCTGPVCRRSPIAGCRSCCTSPTACTLRRTPGCCSSASRLVRRARRRRPSTGISGWRSGRSTEDT